MPGYNPIKLSKAVKNIVVKGNRRKYYRFRRAKFYGGIATADCVGCNLQCLYCWSKRPLKRPKKVGEFYSPGEVAKKLESIASKYNFQRVRISGNEPTIGKEHFLLILDNLKNSNLTFILETNGILIGIDPSYAREISDFPNVHTRVSLKGCDSDQFSELTGAEPEAFELQLQALRNLVSTGASCHAAVIEEFATNQRIISLEERLAEIDVQLTRKLEFESLILYPHVKKRLRKHKISI